MQPILSIENISKKYRINENRNTEVTFRESMASLFRKKRGADSDEFWALKDISFNVMPGESIGIIGKNGAGKSTLLKILSRITPPTKGKITVRGRIASLLEVGTGFHSELSGRENVFLNGSILGMKRNEIKNKFDEIVAFAGVEKFIDTPLKHYSSGMQLRLAFAVAAFLENEILIIDEVLAVGDAEFQKKCLGKMEDVSKNEGRTVLFVSHNMEAVQNLCSSAILIKDGSQLMNQDSESVIKKYLNSFNNNIKNIKWEIENAPGTKYFKWLNISIEDSLNIHKTSFSTSDDVHLSFEFYLNELPHQSFDISYHLTDEKGTLVFATSSAYTFTQKFENGKHIYKTVIPGNVLNYGSYYISRLMAITDKKYIVHELKDVLSFDLTNIDQEYYGWQGSREGIIKPLNAKWQLTHAK